VAQAGLAEEQVPLERMARAILERVMVPQGRTVEQVGDRGMKAANSPRHPLSGSEGVGS